MALAWARWHPLLSLPTIQGSPLAWDLDKARGVQKAPTVPGSPGAWGSQPPPVVLSPDLTAESCVVVVFKSRLPFPTKTFDSEHVKRWTRESTFSLGFWGSLRQPPQFPCVAVTGNSWMVLATCRDARPCPCPPVQHRPGTAGSPATVAVCSAPGGPAPPQPSRV